MKKITKEESKTIQMEVMNAIDLFCTEHNIKYSIAGGTMIGAVRHKGYIPWDDDIDIYMLRDDYENFDKLFPELYMGRYAFVSRKRSKQWHRVCGKVYDVRTLVVNRTKKTTKFGVNVDVFPVDEVPDDEAKWQSFNKRRKMLLTLTAIKAWNFKHERNIKKYIIKSIVKIPLMLISKPKLLKIVDNYIQQYNGKNSQWIFDTSYGFVSKHPFHKKTFDEIIEWPFEDTTLKGFKDADDYLKNAYGDYMTPPPVEKRIGHSEDAYWL